MHLCMSFALQQKITLEQKLFGTFTLESLGTCPKCGHTLTEHEILNGFSDDPHDFKTACPVCGENFLSNLIVKDNETEESRELEPITFMCSDQTLEAMRDIIKERGRIGITYLGKYNRQLFYNMVKHFGSYAKALQMLN